MQGFRDWLPGRSEKGTSYCGIEIADESLPEDLGAWCCLRETWEDEEECRWHVERSNKTREGLEIRTVAPMLVASEDPERLDGAYLRHANIETKEQDHFDWSDFLDFQGCTLINAQFDYGAFPGASFHKADLRKISARDGDFSKIAFDRANLSGSDLEYATFENSRLWRVTANNVDAPGVNFADANLYMAELEESNLPHANLSHAHCTKASFKGTNLENAQLHGTELEGVDLTDAKLYGATIRNTSINEETEFGEVCIYESEADETATAAKRGALLGTLSFYNIGRNDEITNLEKAARVYRMYQRLLRENDLPEGIREFRVREREARRKRAASESDLLQWANFSLQRWLTNYGESPFRIMSASSLVWLISALLYPIGGMQGATGLITYSTHGLIGGFLNGLYFSSVTFTALSYGDVQPLGHSHLIAAIETLLGSLLLALLVFVLGRRTTW